MHPPPPAAAETDPVRPPRRKWRRFRRTAATIVLLLGIALLWPGWPLHPVATVASRLVRAEGIELRVGSPWLRLHLDGVLRLHFASLTVGDAQQPSALELENFDAGWRMRDLFGSRWLPSSIDISGVTAQLRSSSGGALELVAWPTPLEADPATSPGSAIAVPADIPAALLPATGHTLRYRIGRITVRLPAGLPAREVAIHSLDTTITRPESDRLRWDTAAALRIDDRPGRVECAAQLLLGRDWLGQLEAKLTAAPTSSAPPMTLALRLDRPTTNRPLQLGLDLTECTLEDWLPLLGPTNLPAVTGQVALQLEAGIDPVARTLAAARLHLKTSALTIAQPTALARPLPVSPLALDVEIADNGARGTVRPFSVQAGPVDLHCPGIAWAAVGDEVAGEGRLQLAAIRLPELLTWLTPELAAGLPLSPQEAAEIGLEATTINLRLAGTKAGGLPRVHLEAETGLTLNRGAIACSASGDFDPADGSIEATVLLPDFVAARWQLSLLNRFPLPTIDAPVRAEFSAKGKLPDTLDRVRWKLVAGPGTILPHGPLQQWLAKPFPVTSFTLSGVLDDQARHLEIEQLGLRSGRARLELERTALRSAQALTATAGKTGAQARFSLHLRDWYAADFLPLLGPALRPAIEPFAADLALVGLEALDTEFTLDFPALPWLDPQLSALAGKQSAVFRVGEMRLPIELDWGLDPVTRHVTANAQLPDLRLNQLNLPSVQSAGLPLASLDLPFSLTLDLSADPFAPTLEQMAVKAAVGVTAKEGRIRANAWLGADLPVTNFVCSLSTRLVPLSLDRFRLEADFGGPSLQIDDTRFLQGDETRGAFRLRLAQVPLAWLFARVPPAQLPPALGGTVVRGAIDEVDLRTEFRLAKNASLPEPTSLVLAAKASGLGVRLPGRPEATISTVLLRGDLGQIDCLVDHASVSGVVLSDFTATAIDPLQAVRRGRASGRVGVDLEQLPALLASVRDLVALPPELDLAGLAGRISARFSAEAPLDPATFAQTLKAEAEITTTPVLTPLLPATLAGVALRAGFEEFTLRANYQAAPTGPGNLGLDAKLRRFRIQPVARPDIDVDTLTLAGGLDRLALSVDRAGTLGVELRNLEATVETPLTPDGHAQGRGEIGLDLAQAPALLAAYRDFFAMPPTVDLTGLAGSVAARFSVQAPLAPDRLAAELKAHAEAEVAKAVFPMIPAEVRLGPSALQFAADVDGPNLSARYSWRPESLQYQDRFSGAPEVRGTATLTPQTIVTAHTVDLTTAQIALPELCWTKPLGLPAGLDLRATITPRATATPTRIEATLETRGLVCSPLDTVIEATLADENHPALEILPGVAEFALRDTRFGNSTVGFRARRDAAGVSDLQIQAPRIDLSEWVRMLEPNLTAWCAQYARDAAAEPVAAAADPAMIKDPLRIPPAAAPLPALSLPPIQLSVEVPEVVLAPRAELRDIRLRAELRNGYPRSLALHASAGEDSSLKFAISPSDPRSPWDLQLKGFARWFAALTAPLGLLPDAATPPESTLLLLRTLAPAFAGGDLACSGTLDWRDQRETVTGSIKMDHLTLQQELEFLSRIAALVKRRVFLRVPFETLTVPEFAANLDFLSLRKLSIKGPIDVSSDYLNLDVPRSWLDMNGKVFGINFEVTGPTSSPSFYLSDKSTVIQSVTTEDDFEW